MITILKLNKDPTLPASYRPISLINQDAKIFTAILANKIKLIIYHYVHIDQTRFILGRDIADNIRRTLNAILLGRRMALISILIALDIEKAFDTVDVPYMTTLLETMGFGEKFLSIIRSLYSSSISNLLIKCQCSCNYVEKQGKDALFPSVIALCMEPLAHRIRCHPHIIGLKMDSVEHRVSLFADDMTIYLSNPTESLGSLQKE